MLKQTNKQTLILIYLFFSVAPMIWIPNQLIGAAIGNPDVTLECITEAMPKAIAYWVFNGTMVMTAGRYKTHEHHHSNYKLDLKLHIKNIQEEDYGMYKCLSKNSHGDNEGSIQLYSKIVYIRATVTDLANSCVTPLFRRPQGSQGCLEKKNHFTEFEFGSLVR